MNLNNDDDVVVVEEEKGKIVEKRLKLAAPLKLWAVIMVSVLSLGFSIGLWATQGSTNSKQLSEINAMLKDMPATDKIANKDVMESEMRAINCTLVRIEATLNKMSEQVARNQETLVRHIAREGK
jgi:hypothetical protein